MPPASPGRAFSAVLDQRGQRRGSPVRHATVGLLIELLAESNRWPISVPRNFRGGRRWVGPRVHGFASHWHQQRWSRLHVVRARPPSRHLTILPCRASPCLQRRRSQPISRARRASPRSRRSALVVSGSHDIMTPADNAYAMFKALSNAQLVLYPDSGHGALFQYHELFVSHARLFLDA
jgi:pimeloyl-ACP methyl ester carboxylesterase